MHQDLVRFHFGSGTRMREVKATLHLACLAAESLYGVERVRFEAPHSADDVAKTVEIDTTAPVGRTLAIVFAGYVRREFGDGAVRMERSVEPEVAVAV